MRKFCFPTPNRYIPTDFSTLAEHSLSGQNYPVGPQRVYASECMDVHHELDHTVKTPKELISLQMKTSIAYKSPRHWVMFALFMEMLNDSLAEHSYLIRRAGFYFSFEATTNGVDLFVDGYSQRIDDLLLSRS